MLPPRSSASDAGFGTTLCSVTSSEEPSSENSNMRLRPMRSVSCPSQTIRTPPMTNADDTMAMTPLRLRPNSARIDGIA